MVFITLIKTFLSANLYNFIHRAKFFVEKIIKTLKKKQKRTFFRTSREENGLNLVQNKGMNAEKDSFGQNFFA